MTADVYLRNDEPAEKEKQEQAMAGLGHKLLQARTILISGQVDQELAEKVVAQLLVLDADSNDPIRVFVTSQGGHVDSGYAIHDVMRFLGSPIHTIGAGWVASIAVPIMMGAPKENRFSLPNTRFLLHQPSGGAGGQLSDLRIQAEQILLIRQRLNKLLADETGQTIEKIEEDSDRDFWLNAEQAVEYGLVSKIISNTMELPKA